ncbi:DNA-binding response regulator, NarL/FixJ family, contains REC and HTH domains [Rhizobiales bacterium GAS113]|nr:DNA-binding response regulator, NarL/FixJ family, contains REC and HTH domains [Rhizobiales bacterium GAS113]
MARLVQNETATNIGPWVAQQPQTMNATDLSLIRTGASQNQDTVTGSQTFATVIIGRSGLSREGLACILNAGGFRVVGSASRVSELAENSIRPDQPLLLIIDVGVDVETAIKEIELIKQERPAARIAVLAGSDQIRDLISLFQAGAHACFATKATPDAFLKSLELVMLGETLLPQAVLPFILGREDEARRRVRRHLDDELPADRIWSPSNDPTTARFKVGDNVKCVNSNGTPAESERHGAPHLSAQETRILRRLTEGSSNKVIARAIEIAEATVKVHVKAILRKIGVNNRTQAAMWAMRNPPPECGKDDGSPAHILAAVQPTPPSDAGIDGDSPIQPPRAEWPAAGHAVEETTAESLSANKVKSKLGNAFLQQRRALLAERRPAEEEERLANMATKTSHLRELRQTAEREALEINAISLAKKEANDPGRTFDGQQ